ncbi:MAG: N-acetyltransferase family protein [Acidobacteria bacterium]|nr:MAG: N-acetyltransferase family protein [Acidobacteriota bacterium]
MPVTIRIAEERDLPAIVDIYNQAIALGNATADVTPLSTRGKAGWLAEHKPTNHPVFVAESAGDVVGWCSLSPYRPGRMALRYTAEISYYVHEDFRGKGIGSQLLGHAIAESPNLGIKTLFAILLDINIPSVRLLEKFGFEKWGHLPNVADFNGKECGHLYYGLRVKA